MLPIKTFLFFVFIFSRVNCEEAQCETDTVNFPMEDVDIPDSESGCDVDPVEIIVDIYEDEDPAEISDCSINDVELNTDFENEPLESELDCSDISPDFRRCVFRGKDLDFRKVEPSTVSMPVDPPTGAYVNVIDFHIQGKLEDWLAKLLNVTQGNVDKDQPEPTNILKKFIKKILT